jgi:hypothetical protein
LAHHDRPPFSRRPSLTGHCGHGAILGAQRSVAIDPSETWSDQNFRAAKALFVPFLKRGIVTPLHGF